MKLELYSQDNIRKMEIAVNENCTEQVSIQGDSVISLSFKSYEGVVFAVNDYVDFFGKRFWSMGRYVPKQISSVEWEYSLKLYGIESLIKRFLVINTTNSDDEVEFSYTATAYDHAALIVKSINEGMGTTDWKVGAVVASEFLTIDYQGTYCDVALATLAERTGVEYWIEGQTVNVIRCEHGENITLGYSNGLTTLDNTTATNVQFFTRLYPIGSTRNIDPAVYGHSKLQLPGGVKYVDRDVDKFGVVHRYETEAFAHIYPRYTGGITSSRHEEHTSEEGNPFYIFFFKDSSLPFNPNDYEIAGFTKKITFESGDLQGREFEVNYNSQTAEFEIITQYPYDDDTQLPNLSLAPEVGDKYIPWNITMPEEYYPLAEAEFLAAVGEFADEQAKDVSVYKAHTDYVDLAKRGVSLTLGQRVRLENNTYFPEGYRDSRITKITRKILRPTDMDIEISDVLSRGALERVDGEVAELEHYVQAATGGFPDIIRSWEKTLPTDTNILSSRYVFFNFLNKLIDDRAKGKIASDKGFEVGADAGMYGVDETGRSFLRVDYLYANIKAFFNTLEINRVQANSGNRVASPASIKCSSVELRDTFYRCFFVAADESETIKNDFIEDDLAYSTSSGVKSSGDGEFENRYYWRAVVGVGDNYIDLSISDRDPLSDDAPKVGDVIVQRGNKTDSTRQVFIEETSVGANAPSYTLYKGVDSYTLADKEIFELKYDPLIKTALMNHYGDMWLGNRSRTRGIEYDSQKDELRVSASSVVFSKSGKDAEEAITTAQDAATKAQESVDNIQIGGVNFLLGSDVAESFNDGIGWKSYAITESLYPYIGKEIVASFYYDIKGAISSSSKRLIRAEIRYVSTETGQEVYLSPTGSAITIVANDEDIKGRQVWVFVVPKDFPDSTSTSIVSFRTVVTLAAGEGSAYHPQLEVGNKPTAWRLSAVEEESKIEAAQDAANAANVGLSKVATITVYKLGNEGKPEKPEGGTNQEPEGWTKAVPNSLIDGVYYPTYTCQGSVNGAGVVAWGEVALSANDTDYMALGYASYDEMRKAQESGKTIIKGGYMNTDIIDTNSLIAKKIQTAKSGTRVQIMDNTLDVFDDSDEIVTTLSGVRYNSIGEVLDVSNIPQATPITLPSTIIDEGENPMRKPTYKQRTSQKIEVARIQVPDKADLVFFELPLLKIDWKTKYTYTEEGPHGLFYSGASVRYILENAALNIDVSAGGGYESGAVTAKVVERSGSAIMSQSSRGYTSTAAEIVVYVYVEFKDYDNVLYAGDSYYNTVDLSFADPNATDVTFSKELSRTHIFGNGGGYLANTTNYDIRLITDDGIVVETRQGDFYGELWQTESGVMADGTTWIVRRNNRGYQEIQGYTPATSTSGILNVNYPSAFPFKSGSVPYLLPTPTEAVAAVVAIYYKRSESTNTYFQVNRIYTSGTAVAGSKSGFEWRATGFWK